MLDIFFADFGKYELVLLVVGCTTSLVVTWLIVDFFLYHRARRIKREENDHTHIHSRKMGMHLTVPFVTEQSKTTASDVVSGSKLNRQTSIRRLLNFFSRKKSNEDLNMRSKSLDDEETNHKRTLWTRARRLTEMFSNKVSNLNNETDSITSADKVQSGLEQLDRTQVSDKENSGGSSDSGRFSADRKGAESKFETDVDEMDVTGRSYNFGFSDLDEEGMRKPQSRKARKSKEGKPTKNFALLQFRYY